MANFLGYGKTNLEWFFDWHGRNGNPLVGTVNEIMGFNSSNSVFRYTFPMIHKSSTCEYDSCGMVVEGSIIGAEQDVIFSIYDDCPTSPINKLQEIKDKMFELYGSYDLLTKQWAVDNWIRQPIVE